MSAENKRKYINSVILIVSILVIGLALLFWYKLTYMKDDEESEKFKSFFVVVLIGGKEEYRYPLDEDREFLIENGNNENLLVIKDGKASVKTANCKDKICVSHNKISKDGETIICLPHKLVISVEGVADEN